MVVFAIKYYIHFYRLILLFFTPYHLNRMFQVAFSLPETGTRANPNRREVTKIPLFFRFGQKSNNTRRNAYQS